MPKQRGQSSLARQMAGIAGLLPEAPNTCRHTADSVLSLKDNSIYDLHHQYLEERSWAKRTFGQK
jgi:hypothetical protein